MFLTIGPNSKAALLPRADTCVKMIRAIFVKIVLTSRWSSIGEYITSLK